MGGAMNRTVAEVFAPGEFIKEELEARGWAQVELAEILGRPAQVVNEIIAGKRAITPETAHGLAAAFGTSAQVWMNLEGAYQLWKVEQNKTRDTDVSKRASLYSKVPVREMVRRRWVERSDNPEVLADRILAFYGIKSFDEQPRFWPVAARTSATSLTLAHWAWLARARQLARAVSVHRFSDSELSAAVEKLRQLLHVPEETRHVPKILAEAGVRLVIIEHLPRTKIDGACLWLDSKSPVVVLSLRFDRIDHFWHTLFHEIGHVINKHGLTDWEPFDIDIFGETATGKSGPERLVDDFATNTLIPRSELEDFISRVSPLYSKDKIRGFARRLQVHPGIVVGQLQHRKQIDWSHSRDMLAKVRHFVVGAALADGWGNAVPVTTRSEVR
jgi:HTH-type transcriptional regulator / antitoxin HigA